MYIVFFLVAFIACTIGKICGMGGGVIIKPVLDAFGVMSVSSINLLSGCTVIGMTLWSVCKTALQGNSKVDIRSSTPLAIGAAIGGIMGKELFSSVEKLFSDPNRAGGIQAGILFIAMMATLIYTVKKDKVKSMHVTNPVVIVFIGLVLGMLGSFLGIGGGPFNMAVLFLFFSMPVKTAAQNSLYIILISQVTSLIRQVLSGHLPPIIPAVLIGMVVFGIIGSEVGGNINKRLTDKSATVLFECATILVMAICVYNGYKFLT